MGAKIEEQMETKEENRTAEEHVADDISRCLSEQGALGSTSGPGALRKRPRLRKGSSRQVTGLRGAQL
jgi:hypothetical protein